MLQSLRQPDILEIARRDGRVTVEGLARRFGVSVQTIRRDLAEMDQAGLVTRVHGGAVLPSGVRNVGYEDRRGMHAEAKAAIGRQAAALIPDGSSLFLNIGTTTEAVARALLQHEALLVVTNNLNVANILAGNPDCEVVVAGGSLRRADGGLTGHLTMQVIRQFRLDFAVIGCSALDEGGDVLDFDVSEVSVSQTILAQARRSVLVADASKLHHAAPARITTLADLDVVVTDAALPDALAARCRAWATEIVVARA